MKRKRNASCVYTGAVGARMRVPVRRPTRRIDKAKVLLCNGPLHGQAVWLDADSNRTTFELAPMGGHPAGQYRFGMWYPSI